MDNSNDLLTSLGKLKILLVEDNEISQYLGRILLEGWGFVIDIANDGKEALELLNTSDYNLILMDLHMPEMGGIEAVQHIRKLEDPAKANLPIIALTASMDIEETDKYRELQFDDCLAKPFDEANLLSKITKHVKKLDHS